MKAQSPVPKRQQVGEHYTVVKKIGQGGFGEAFLVRDARRKSGDPQYRVAKKMALSTMTDKERDQAMREAMLMAQFSNHPFIVHYEEAFVQDVYLYVIMDYCERGDLHDQMSERKQNNKPYSEREVLTRFTQILLAVFHLHKHHVLHRDIKLSNVLVTKKKLQLTDFGISKCLEAQMAKTLTGTIPFMSPEIFQGVPYGYPADIWALGCLLFELITFRVPFMHVTQHRLAQAIMNEPVPPFPGRVSPALSSLCLSLLTKDPKTRPTASELIKHPLIQKTLPTLLSSEAKKAK